MKQTFTVRRNADGTVTFKYLRYIEHIDAANLGIFDTYERLKMAALTAGLRLSDDTLEELLKIARGINDPVAPRPGRGGYEAGRKEYVRISTDAVLAWLHGRGGWERPEAVASRFNVSVNTARRKLDALVAEGRAYKRGPAYQANGRRRLEEGR